MCDVKHWNQSQASGSTICEEATFFSQGVYQTVFIHSSPLFNLPFVSHYRWAASYHCIIQLFLLMAVKIKREVVFFSNK